MAQQEKAYYGSLVTGVPAPEPRKSDTMAHICNPRILVTEWWWHEDRGIILNHVQNSRYNRDLNRHKERTSSQEVALCPPHANIQTREQ